VRRRVRSTVAAALAGFTLGLWGPAAAAQTDYAPGHRGWNGTAELLALATEAEVELVPTTTLDWAEVQRGQALLVLYPRGRASTWPTCRRSSEEGGRVAWFDDFGRRSALLDGGFSFSARPGARAPLARPSCPSSCSPGRGSCTRSPRGSTRWSPTSPWRSCTRGCRPLFDFGSTPAQGLVLVGRLAGQARRRRRPERAHQHHDALPGQPSLRPQPPGLPRRTGLRGDDGVRRHPRAGQLPGAGARRARRPARP
jgi:hypothetical protein